MDKIPFFHALKIDEDTCIGCSRCMKICPTEALRVRDGKAVLIPDRCVDCGNCFKVCPRQALHARTLGFVHPVTKKQMDFESPMPSDLATLIDKWHVKMKGDEYKNIQE